MYSRTNACMKKASLNWIMYTDITLHTIIYVPVYMQLCSPATTS